MYIYITTQIDNILGNSRKIDETEIQNEVQPENEVFQSTISKASSIFAAANISIPTGTFDLISLFLITCYYNYAMKLRFLFQCLQLNRLSLLLQYRQ